MADYVYPLRITTSGLAPSAHTVGCEVMLLITTGTTQAAAANAIQNNGVSISVPINAGGTSVWLTLTSETVYVGYAAYTFFSTFQTGVTSSPLSLGNVTSISVPVSLIGSNQRERYVKKMHYDFVMDEYNDPSIMSTINERNFTGKYIRKDYVSSPFATYSSDTSNRYVPSKMLFWTVNAKSSEVTYEEPEGQMKDITWINNVINYGGHGPFSYRFDLAGGGYSFDTDVDGSSGGPGTTSSQTTISIPSSLSPGSLEGSYSPTVQGAVLEESATVNSKTCTLHIPTEDFKFDIIVRAFSPNYTNLLKHYNFRFDLSSLTIVDQIAISGMTCSGQTTGVYKAGTQNVNTGPLYQDIHIKGGQWLRFYVEDEDEEQWNSMRFITEDGYDYEANSADTHFVNNGRMYTMQVSDSTFLSAKTLYVDYILYAGTFSVSAVTTSISWVNNSSYDITIPSTNPNSYITVFDENHNSYSMYRIAASTSTLAASSYGTITPAKLLSNKNGIATISANINASRSGGALTAVMNINNGQIILTGHVLAGQSAITLSEYSLQSDLSISSIQITFSNG